MKGVDGGDYAQQRFMILLLKRVHVDMMDNTELQRFVQFLKIRILRWNDRKEI